MAPLRKTSLSMQLADELGKAIISGHYNSAHALPTEAKLCEQYNISRTAVREAVKMLAAKGIISSRPRQGIRIEDADNWNLYDPQVLTWMLDSNPSLSILKEFLEMRLAIEPQAAALAAQRADSESIAKIEHAWKNMAASVDCDSNFHRYDIDFHLELLNASGNRFLRQLRDFTSTALNVSVRYTTPIKGDTRMVVEAHKNLFLAVANGEVDKARALSVSMIEEAIALIEQVNR